MVWWEQTDPKGLNVYFLPTLLVLCVLAQGFPRCHFYPYLETQASRAATLEVFPLAVVEQEERVEKH